MRIAITADLHFGHNAVGDEATYLLRDYLEKNIPDLFLLGGDVGTGDHFDECLRLFAPLPCPKGLVAGNHDIWVNDDDPRGDSLHVFEHHLPTLSRNLGYEYLDFAPLVFPDVGLAVVGTMNWYDYSWSLERLKNEIPNWQWHLENKAFTRGRHNDGRFVRWVMDDVSFTRNLVTAFEHHVSQLNDTTKLLVLTHHPAVREVSFPRESPPQGVDGLLWDALSGNRLLEDFLKTNADRLAVIFSGHTHRAVTRSFFGVPCHNVGGDYHFKCLTTWDWPSGHTEQHVFGDPSRGRR